MKSNDIALEQAHLNGMAEKDPLIRFDGRVAVVTGAGGGLGRVYALELARRGTKVVVNDLGCARDGSDAGTSGPAERVVEEIRSMGGEAVTSCESVATPEGGEAIVQTALDAFGRLDILINNAGILRDTSLLKMEPANWDVVMDVNLNGAFNVTCPAFRVMRKQSYGRIILTTSAAGLYGNFGQTNYSSAKMGLVGFMNSLKWEGQKYGILVNTVAPIAASRLTEDVLPPEFLDRMKPEYVAPLVLYLLSEKCPTTGMIYNAGMGFFNRAAMMTGPGAFIGAGGQMPTPEDIAQEWDKIVNLREAKEYGHMSELVGDLLKASAQKPPEPTTVGAK